MRTLRGRQRPSISRFPRCCREDRQCDSEGDQGRQGSGPDRRHRGAALWPRRRDAIDHQQTENPLGDDPACSNDVVRAAPAVPWGFQWRKGPAALEGCHQRSGSHRLAWSCVRLRSCNHHGPAVQKTIRVWDGESHLQRRARTTESGIDGSLDRNAVVEEDKQLFALPPYKVHELGEAAWDGDRDAALPPTQQPGSAATAAATGMTIMTPCSRSSN